jgi:DivIVA domain-containing protein
VDRDSIDRIRSATFPVGRRGYEKREVDRFLNQLADWLETGGADQARTELVRRELERVGEQTGKVLTGAHDAGEQLRTDAEHEAQVVAEEASARAEQTRAAADQQSAETRAAADAYAETTRAEASKVREESEAAAAEIRTRADRESEKTVAKAKAEAKQLVDEATQRRRDVEAVISDLEARRNTVVADLERLSTELAGTATEHRPVAEPARPEPGTARSAGVEKPQPAGARSKATG